ncbi:hypothetical protein NEMBOFW57_009414 [Staphylotrichum longicolle]|uniref:Large ribosomal subunit protein mL49 n=1 Tax=Staphylotrichum longicolle TaxID=669026 RepID=A0AAD4EP06_9PEZI|nr:hypothetical protein NEMBOFW57_009414 [Staphylotrichum longicolle]
MFRPATLLRALAAPARQILLFPQAAAVSAPSTLLIRRCLATAATTTTTTPTTPSSTPSDPTTPQTPSSQSATATPSPEKKSNAHAWKYHLLRVRRRAAKAAAAKAALPFHVSRTPSAELPVYTLAKRGGNKKLTTIKKIDGDRAALGAQLAADLGLEVGGKGVVVNARTGHLVVEGHRAAEVKQWLTDKGF